MSAQATHTTRPVPFVTRALLLRLGQYALLLAILVVLLFPIYYMVATSVMPLDEFLRVPPRLVPGSIKLDNYPFMFRRWSYIPGLINTILIAGLSALGATLLGGMAAYSFSRATFAGKALMYSLLVASIAVPAMVTLGPIFITYFEIGLLDTRHGIILVYLAGGLPLAVLVLFTYYNAVPRELDDAAAIDGCGWFGTLFRVILPIALPGAFVTFLLLLIAGWNEFLFAFVLTVGPETRVLMVRLLEAGGRSYVLRSAGGVLILLPLVPLLPLVQKQLVRGITFGVGGDR